MFYQRNVTGFGSVEVKASHRQKDGQSMSRMGA
jgi:hypothetical protein